MKKYVIRILILCAILLAENGLEVLKAESGSSAILPAKAPLVVLTRNAGTTYYEGPYGLKGFEHDLVKVFAQFLGVTVQWKVLDSVEEILAAMVQGQGDMAAAGLTRTVAREKRFVFGPEYDYIQQNVVCRRDGPFPKRIEDLAQCKILVIGGSSYVERLEELKKEFPALQWQVTHELSSEQILEKVVKGEVDCTVADSNIVKINRRFFPELKVSFSLTEKQPLAWIVNRERRDLQSALEEWLSLFKKSGKLAELHAAYYAYVGIFDYVDLAVYHRHIRERLPDYSSYFREAERFYELPWTLLAAQAYQESHWNPEAKSPTGVRGIMMLTQATARAMGVSDRLNPRESIMGGAKYLVHLEKRIAADIKEPDRSRFMLASYNIGMGHIYDAQALAKKLGRNPNSWQDLKDVLPLLSQKKYFKNLKYGYAHGLEPVKYVERIRNYHEILVVVAETGP